LFAQTTIKEEGEGNNIINILMGEDIENMPLDSQI